MRPNPRLEPFIGKVPAKRLLIKRRTFTGQYRQLKVPSNVRLIVPEEVEEKLFERLQKKKKNQSSFQESAKRVLEIFDLLRTQSNRPITYLELASSLAFQHGLSKEKLLPHINAALSAQSYLKKRGVSNVVGNFSVLGDSVKHDIPQKVFLLLGGQIGPVSASFFVKKFGFKRSRVNVALLLLEQMRLITKFPQESGGHGGQEYRWGLENNQFSSSTFPKKNVAFRLFMQLAKGPGGVNELLLDSMKRSGKNIVKHSSKKGFAPAPTIQKAIGLLISAGLVRVEKKGTVKTYSLTEEGKRIAVRQSKESYLLPDLRKILLGRSKRFERRLYNRLSVARKTKLDLIKTFIEARIKFESTGREKFGRGEKAVFAAEFGKTINFISTIQNLSWVPWSNLSNESLDRIYLPVLDEITPPASERFRQRLKKERKFIAKPIINSTVVGDFGKAKQIFLAQHKLPEASFDRMFFALKQNFSSKPSTFGQIADVVSKKANMPYNEANNFAQFVFYRWNDIV